MLQICYTEFMNKTSTKKRINISVSEDMNRILNKLARRDNVPVATKTSELLKEVIEIEEDVIWEKLVEVRDTKNAKYLSHKKAWK